MEEDKHFTDRPVFRFACVSIKIRLAVVLRAGFAFVQTFLNVPQSVGNRRSRESLAEWLSCLILRCWSKANKSDAHSPPICWVMCVCVCLSCLEESCYTLHTGAVKLKEAGRRRAAAALAGSDIWMLVSVFAQRIVSSSVRHIHMKIALITGWLKAAKRANSGWLMMD